MTPATFLRFQRRFDDQNIGPWTPVDKAQAFRPAMHSKHGSNQGRPKGLSGPEPRQSDPGPYRMNANDLHPHKVRKTQLNAQRTSIRPHSCGYMPSDSWTPIAVAISVLPVPGPPAERCWWRHPGSRSGGVAARAPRGAPSSFGLSLRIGPAAMGAPSRSHPRSRAACQNPPYLKAKRSGRKVESIGCSLPVAISYASNSPTIRPSVAPLWLKAT